MLEHGYHVGYIKETPVLFIQNEDGYSWVRINDVNISQEEINTLISRDKAKRLRLKLGIIK